MLLKVHMYKSFMVLQPTTSRLDLSLVTELRQEAKAMIGDQQKVAIDLGAVEFVDSSCLGVFVAIHKSLKGGFPLHSIAPNESVAILLEITRLDQVLVSVSSINQLD